VWRDVVAAQRARDTRRAPVAMAEAEAEAGATTAARVLFAEHGLAVIWKPKGMGTRGHHSGSLQVHRGRSRMQCGSVMRCPCVC
jgi:hypothetical protein